MDDFGVATTRLMLAFQRHLFRELAARGYDDIRPRHGAVLAHLGEGARATDLAADSGRSKQTVTRLVDELEGLGYVQRAPDPHDRRGKIVVPTERGRHEIAAAHDIGAELESHYAEVLGTGSYHRWRAQLAQLLAHTPTSDQDEEDRR